MTLTILKSEALENTAWQAKKCRIAWVKAHLGTEGNEKADKAAQQGEENINKTLQIINTPIPAEHAKSIIDEAIGKE